MTDNTAIEAEECQKAFEEEWSALLLTCADSYRFVKSHAWFFWQAAWNRRSGEMLQLKSGEEYTIIIPDCNIKYAALLDALREVQLDLASLLDANPDGKCVTVPRTPVWRAERALTRILDEHEEHNVSGT